jgi:hypothetical protein
MLIAGRPRGEFRGARPLDSQQLGVGAHLSAQFSGQDMQHLNAFSPHKKAQLLQTIMARPAMRQRTCTSNAQNDLALAKLRKGGYGLIDLQSMETAFTSVWYRKTSRLLGLDTKETVVMLVWEFNGAKGDDTTTLLSTWEL